MNSDCKQCFDRTHIQQCSFQKIRSVFDDIYEHFKNIYESLVDELQTVRQQLEKQLQRNNEQNRFLLAVFKKGKANEWPMFRSFAILSMSGTTKHSNELSGANAQPVIDYNIGHYRK